MFPVQWPILSSLLGTLSVNITYLKIPYANHKHSCASPLSVVKTFNLITGLKISIISMLVGTLAESLIKEDLNVFTSFPCEGFPHLLSWCCRPRLCRLLVNQQSVTASFGVWWQFTLPVPQLELTVDRLVFCSSNLLNTTEIQSRTTERLPIF